MFKFPGNTEVRLFCIAVLLAVGSITSPWVSAQTAITDWTLSYSDGPNEVEDGITYRNTALAITGFSTASSAYYLGATASSAFIRRNTDSNGNGTHNQAGIDNNNRSSTWGAQASGQNNLFGSYETTLNDVLLNNNILMGGDDLLANSNNTSDRSSANIERLDFYFGATTVNATDGLTIFDRGNAGAHDNVKIAVFTSWGSGEPTTYAGNVVTLTTAEYGANLDTNPSAAGTQASFTYTLLRFNNGDSLATLDTPTNTGTQGIAGAFISFADLGIATGTTIYGYSILAADVTTDVQQLADWKNSTHFPTGTNSANGGIDLVSFNGRIARPVPEPATYGALFLGGMLGFWWLSRRKSSAALAAR